ncbi:cytochrome P450 [Phenylobacterium sp. J367]|uniref:cytochrome P450 n=1 Tax=Phenylobacterium sp. J367 TaxID=2898435 RepID=UPI002150A221|nr:cytochrome P450 [Phenylobacterium sp. J367]MCR5879571.1 cytochrome P450 [Phenylobacterium sp. J367]
MTTGEKIAEKGAAAGKPLAEFQFPSPEVTKCPYPFYEALRSEAPVYKYPDRNDFLISRREDILFVLRQPDIFSNRTYLADEWAPGAERRAELELKPPGGVLETSFGLTSSDPPEHSVKRRALRSLINPRYIHSCEETLRRLANELIDGFQSRGSVELRGEFADPLAMLTICELAGFDPNDREIFLSWHRIGTGHGRRFLSAEQLAEQSKDQPEQQAYCERIIQDRLANPRDDFLTEVIQAQIERDGEINLPYLIGEIRLILTAGNETTSRLITNVMKLLIEHPDQLAKVVADRDLVPNAIDEALRYECPTQWTSRLVMQDTEIGGVAVPKGAFVLMLYGSANRDDTWTDPDKFDIERPSVRELNMAFGGGIHRCLGSPIALAEGRIALEVMLDRLKNPRFAPGHEEERENIDNFQKRVPKKLFIEFDTP